MFEITNGLTWADWCYTSQNKLALRHLHERLTADNEVKKGGQGDACSLVIPNLHKLTSDQIKREDSQFVQAIDKAVKKLLNERYKYLKIAHSDYHDALELCYVKLRVCTTVSKRKDVLTAMFNLFLADWIRTAHEFVDSTKDSYFLVIEHPYAHKPRDFEGYVLGKCARQGPTDMRWRVHLQMIEVFTYVAKNTHENNFNALTGRIQKCRIGNAIREFPNPIEDGPVDKSNSKPAEGAPVGTSDDYLIAGGLIAAAALLILGGVIYARSGSSLNKA